MRVPTTTNIVLRDNITLLNVYVTSKKEIKSSPYFASGEKSTGTLALITPPKNIGCFQLGCITMMNYYVALSCNCDGCEGREGNRSDANQQQKTVAQQEKAVSTSLLSSVPVCFLRSQRRIAGPFRVLSRPSLATFFQQSTLIFRVVFENFIQILKSFPDRKEKVGRERCNG